MPEEKCPNCGGTGVVQVVPKPAPTTPFYQDKNFWINIITLAALIFGGYKADDKIKDISDKAVALDGKAVAIEKKADEAVIHAKASADTITETAKEVKSFREKMIPKD